MHIFGRPAVDEEYIPEKLEDLNEDKLLDLQHELQSAVKYHDAAQTYGDHAFARGAFTPAGASKPASNEKVRHSSQVEEIVDSSLYRSTVNELCERCDLATDGNFVGWIGLEDSSIEDINNALSTVAKRDVSNRVSNISAPADKEVAAAEDTLESYDVNGYFVEFTDLEREFTEHYTTGLSTRGKWN